MLYVLTSALSKHRRHIPYCVRMLWGHERPIEQAQQPWRRSLRAVIQAASDERETQVTPACEETSDASLRPGVYSYDE